MVCLRVLQCAMFCIVRSLTVTVHQKGVKKWLLLKGIRTFPKNGSDFTRRKSVSELVPVRNFRALATLGSAHELFPFGRSPSSRPVILRLAAAKHSVTDHEEGERCGLLRLSREPLSLDP